MESNPQKFKLLWIWFHEYSNFCGFPSRTGTHKTTTLQALNISGCKLQTRPNIQHTNNPQVRRTARLQAGVQSPFIDTTKYSPEGATDRQQSIACHPFGVPFNHHHWCRGLHPCLCSAVPFVDLLGKQFINNHWPATTLRVVNIPGCKSKTRHNLQHTDNPKVRRTGRLQTGV